MILSSTQASMLKGMTTQAQVGRPLEVLTTRQLNELLRAYRADVAAIANAERKRAAFGVVLRRLREEGASPAAMSRATGLARQSLYTIMGE